MKDKRHIVISGPSGSGKSTLTKKLLNSNPLFKFSISHTTRPKRPTEVNGKDYFFISPVEFEEMIYKNKFIEYARYNNNYYGTSIDQLESKKILILDLERQGVMNLMRMKYDFRYVFVYATKDDLLRRLVGRTEVKSMRDLVEIDNRLKEYERDMGVFRRGIYDIGVVNEDLECAFEEINAFLYKNE